MELLEYIWNNSTVRIISLSLIGLITLIIIILFIIHVRKTKRGEYSKFFWIESGEREQSNQQQNTSNVSGKNINTGTNYGKVGDN